MMQPRESWFDEPEIDSGAVLAVDPGSAESGLVVYNGDRLLRREILNNEFVIETLPKLFSEGMHCVVEYTDPYVLRRQPTPREPKGEPYVPRQVFTTAYFVGRFAQAWITLSGEEPKLVPRREVLKHVTGKGSRVGDKEVRAALIARFGGKEAAIGSKAKPGPLYGVTSHLWAALGLAVTYHDRVIADQAEPAF